MRLLARTDAVAALPGTDDGANLLTAYRRAANILRIEERKDGPHDGAADPALLQLPEEAAKLALAEPTRSSRVDSPSPWRSWPTAAFARRHGCGLAALRPPLDALLRPGYGK